MVENWLNYIVGIVFDMINIVIGKKTYNYVYYYNIKNYPGGNVNGFRGPSLKTTSAQRVFSVFFRLPI